MASLMENLMDILETEGKYYDELLELSMKKTQAIVVSDIELLQQITEQEQDKVDHVNAADKKRIGVMKDIANVMNKDVEELTIPYLVKVLDSRPEEQNRLAQVNDHLKRTVTNMARVNDQNKELIQNALEMVEFDLNIVRGLKAAPETAEYNRGAMNTGNMMGLPTGRFDAKQ